MMSVFSFLKVNTDFFLLEFVKSVTGPKGHIIFLSFGQTLVHNCWSSTNNTSLMSEEIKISTTLMISENTNNASSKKFILVNQNKPLPIFE